MALMISAIISIINIYNAFESTDKNFITHRKTFNAVSVGNNIYGKITRVRKVDTGERNPITILSYQVPFTPQKNIVYKNLDVRVHPTQKPLALMEYLIKTYTNEGETVLDFTMGSGTTGVACKNLKRNFIGIELEEKYFKIAKDRISSTRITGGLM
jgi:site-specific DNA-methyltransferase (adenine-specific)